MKTKKLNISLLYAEDELETRKNVSDILSRRINNFFVAKNGKEAFEIYKKHQPKLVLTDIQMPSMSGLQLAEKIKQINPHAKIIMMTAFTDTNYMLKAIELQVDGFIVKPIIKENLIQVIQKQADIILTEEKAKEQEKELINSEEKYRLLFNQLPYGGEVIDTNGIIIDCSPSTSRMLGYECEELIGRHITNFVDGETVSFFKQNFPKLVKGEQISFEACMIHKNGTKINVLRAAQPIIDDNGNIESILALNIDITKRKKAEAELHKLSTLVLQSPTVMAITDLNGNIEFVNSKFEELYGYTNDEIIGLNPRVLKSDNHPKSFYKKMWDTISSGKEWYGEIYNKNKDGDCYWEAAHIFPIFNKNGVITNYVKESEDITERKKAEEELYQSLEREKNQANIIRISPVAIAFGYPDGRLDNCNKAYADLTGYSQEELKEINWNKVLTPSKWNKIEGEALEKLTPENNHIKYQKEYIHKDGSVVPVELVVTAKFNDKNKLLHFIAFVTDITVRKQAEENIRKQNIELQERNVELDAFSHTVAHDLKNPIGNIMGFANLLLNDYLSLSHKELERYINIIIKSGNKTQQIINSLLQFASVRENEVKAEPFSIKVVVSEAISRFSSLIEKKNVEIFLPKKWPEAIGHAPWIEEVFVNYISNAIKYGGTPPIIELGFDIEESKKSRKRMARFWVRDNGVGINEADHDVIFNKFERLNQADTKGQGLGLSIVHRIIEKLGGKVGLESKSGEGCLFYFTLPISESEYKLHKLKNSEHNTISLKPASKKLKILIVEDDFVSSQLMHIIVANKCEKVFLAADGKEAVELFTKNRDIDLILMDIYMPQMNGLEATKQIRKLDKDVVIIAQTAFAFEGDSEKAIEAGCNEYITKPINKDDLFKTIKKLMN